jgi:peroxiredoxin
MIVFEIPILRADGENAHPLKWWVQACLLRNLGRWILLGWSLAQALVTTVAAEMLVADGIAPRLPEKQMHLTIKADLGKWETAGFQWLMQQEPVEAFRAFRMAKHLDGRSAFAWWGQGYCQRSEKLIAGPFFTQAKRLDPTQVLFQPWVDPGFEKYDDDLFDPAKLASMSLEEASQLAAQLPQPGMWEWLAKWAEWQPAQRLFLLEGALRMRWKLVSTETQQLAGEMTAISRLLHALMPLWAQLAAADQKSRQLAINQTNSSLPEIFGKRIVFSSERPVGVALELMQAQLLGCPKLADCGPLGWKPSSVGPITTKFLSDNAGEPEPGQQKPWTLINVYLDGKCPRCLNQMTLLAGELAKFEPLHTQVFCIGGDSTEQAAKTKPLEGNAAHLSEFPFVLIADADRKLAKELLCQDPYTDLPAHGTFVCDNKNQLRWWYTGELPYEDFPSLQEELSRLQKNPPYSQP